MWLTCLFSSNCDKNVDHGCDRPPRPSPCLSRMQICKQLGGTIDDSELVHGMVFEKGAKKSAGGPTRIENAKVRAYVNRMLCLLPFFSSRYVL